MKKNSLNFIYAAALLLAVGLVGCSRESANDENEARSVVLTVTSSSTRAVTEPITGSTTTPLKAYGRVFFVSSGGTITKMLPIMADTDSGTDYATSSGATLNIKDLKLGTAVEITGVPSNSTQVYVVSGLPAANFFDAVGAATNVSAYLAAAYDVEDAYDSETSTLGGVRTVPQIGSGIIVHDGSAYADQFVAAVDIYPAVGRVELTQLTGKTGEITSFKVQGVYVNNFFETISLDGTPASYVPKDNGSTTAEYSGTNPGYYENKPWVYDEHASTGWESAGGVLKFEKTSDSGEVLGYNLLARQLGSTDHYFPHLVIEITDVVCVDSDNHNLYKDKTWYLTITNVVAHDAVQIEDNWVKFEAGKVYQIENLPFELGNLSPVPEPSDKKVTCTVTVKPWVVMNVDPVLGN
jgi:hypothetical protein